MGSSLREWFGRNRGGLAVGLLGMLAVGLAALFMQRPVSAPLGIQPPTVRPSPSPAPVAPMAIHVSGEVARPGLYALAPGSRVDDAVRAAGGASEQADVERLNLAARISDGQQIVVPRKGDPRLAASTEAGAPAPVNINLAGVAELDRLPGVGPVSAQRIVAYREQHGLFDRVDRLREAKLVNAATFEKIRNLVTV